MIDATTPHTLDKRGECGFFVTWSRRTWFIMEGMTMKRAKDFSGNYDNLPITFTDNEDEKREARLARAKFDQDGRHYRLDILNPDGTKDSVLLHADTPIEVRE